MTPQTLHRASTAEANTLFEPDPLAELLGVRLERRRPARGIRRQGACA